MAVTSLPFTLPVYRASSKCNWPRATVSAIAGREALRSPKKSVAASGLYFGWLCMSCRQALADNMALRATAPRIALCRNNSHLTASQFAKKLQRLLGTEFRIRGLNAQEETIDRCPGKLRHVKHRMVWLRQAVHCEHADERGDGRQQNHALERDRNPGGPA